MFFLASGVPFCDTNEAASLLRKAGIEFAPCSGQGNEAPMLCEGAERPERHVAIGLEAIAEKIGELASPEQERLFLPRSQLATV